MQVRVVVVGSEELRAKLRNLDPSVNRTIIRNSLIRSAFEVQTAATKEIAGGGRGKNKALPPLPSRLTSRTGTLRRSIRVNRSPLPFAIEIGTDLVYGAIHEIGGTVSFPATTINRKSKNSVRVGGKRIRYKESKSHTRKAYSATYPPRPFLRPAVEKTSIKFEDIFLSEWKKAAFA